MILKRSRLIPVDKCGVWLTRVIHTYTKLKQIARINHYIKISVRVTVPNNFLRKKKKMKSVFVKSSFFKKKKDNTVYKTPINSNIHLKKRMVSRGKRIVGPIDFFIKSKKLKSYFINIV